MLSTMKQILPKTSKKVVPLSPTAQDQQSLNKVSPLSSPTTQDQQPLSPTAQDQQPLNEVSPSSSPTKHRHTLVIPEKTQKILLKEIGDTHYQATIKGNIKREETIDIADAILGVAKEIIQTIPVINGFVGVAISFVKLQISYHDLKNNIIDFQLLIEKYGHELEIMLKLFNDTVINDPNIMNESNLTLEQKKEKRDDLISIQDTIKEIKKSFDKNKEYLSKIYYVTKLDVDTETPGTDDSTDEHSTSDNGTDELDSSKSNTPLESISLGELTSLTDSNVDIKRISFLKGLNKLITSIKDIDFKKKLNESFNRISSFKIYSLIRNPDRINAKIQTFITEIINQIILLLIQITNYLFKQQKELEQNVLSKKTDTIKLEESKIEELEQNKKMIDGLLGNLDKNIKGHDELFDKAIINNDNDIQQIDMNEAVIKTIEETKPPAEIKQQIDNWVKAINEPVNDPQFKDSDVYPFDKHEHEDESKYEGSSKIGGTKKKYFKKKYFKTKKSKRLRSKLTHFKLTHSRRIYSKRLRYKRRHSRRK
jgi:hypothetical protein